MSIGQILASGDASGRGRRASRAAFGLVLLAAVFAAVPAQARAHRSHHRAAGRVAISGVNCTPTYTTVTCTFATSRAAVASVGTGTSKQVLVVTTEGRRHASHAVTVRGLEPGFEYFARIQAAAPGGKPASVWTSFSTLGPGDGPAPMVTTQGRYWLLNGSRFIPIVDSNGQDGGSDVCPQADQVSTELATGARIVLDFTSDPAEPAACGSSQADEISLMHQALAGRMWWNRSDYPLTPDPAQPQQAELLHWSKQASGPGMSVPAKDATGCQKSSADLYPASGGLVGLMLGRTVSNGHLICTGPWLGNQFWAAVSRGSGLSFDADTYININPGYYAPVPKRVAEAGKLSGRLATLAPAMLYGRLLDTKQVYAKVPLWKDEGGKWRVVFTGESPVVKLFGWRYGGKIYLLAVNVGVWGDIATHWNTHVNGVWHHYTWRPSAGLKLKGLKGAKTAGLWGAKGLKLRGSTATIHLPNLGTGWYVIMPRTK